MKHKLWICALVCVLIALFCAAAGAAQYHAVPRTERYIDHIVNADADSTIGVTTIPDDHMVGDDFVSHLPLVVIDTGGQEIVSYTKYNSETDAFEIPEGIDPYVPMHISVYDSADHRNSPADEAALTSAGRIKVRGNSSSSDDLPKFQYTLKLETEDGDEQPLSMMGIGTDDTWILSPTVRDLSRVRNYIAYNITGQVKEFQPDLRYCEVLFYNNGSYYYNGIYMMCESVKVSTDRINISKDSSKYHVGQGYLLRKDRYDPTAVTLNTWATGEGYYDLSTEEHVNRSFFTLEYPKNENATADIVENITKDLSQIEYMLYSNKETSYLTLNKTLDLQSFADFFIFNEFFASYDAGLHSTFFYKDSGGKLTAGPYWDFDGAMDNSQRDLTDENYIVLADYPWMSQLLSYSQFKSLVEQRYRELRKTILSDEYIEKMIWDTQAYLGNALLREQSAFKDYIYYLGTFGEGATGLPIARTQKTPEAEAQRIIDFLHLHGKYMDENISELQSYATYPAKSSTNAVIATLIILAFLVSTILVRRYRYIR